MLTSAREVTWRSEVPPKPCWANSSSAAPRMRSLVENRVVVDICCNRVGEAGSNVCLDARAIRAGGQTGAVNAPPDPIELLPAKSAKPASHRGFLHANLRSEERRVGKECR